MQLKTCKGGKKKRLMFWCGQRFDNAKSCLCRAKCPVVLSCVVCLLPVFRSDRQYVGNFAWGKKQPRGTVRDQIHVEKEKGRKVIHNNTYCTRYCSVRKKAHSAAQHSTAAKGTAPHRTAPHCPALRCWAIYSRTDLSWASNSVVPGMYKPGVVVPVSTINLKVFVGSNPGVIGGKKLSP